jgi:hypothetical protein
MGNGTKTYCRDIAELVLLACQNLSQNAAHDLTTSRLGEISNDVDGLGGSKGADALSDLQDKLLAESVCSLVSVLDGNEGVDGLAGQLVRNTNDGRLSNGVVLNKSSLNLSSRETVTADVDDVIDTASDPVEALVVTGSTVASELYVRLSV